MNKSDENKIVYLLEEIISNLKFLVDDVREKNDREDRKLEKFQSGWQQSQNIIGKYYDK
jgi:hypothetical protein